MFSEYWYFVRFVLGDLFQKKYIKSQISLHIKSLKNVQSSYFFGKTHYAKIVQNCQ